MLPVVEDEAAIIALKKDRERSLAALRAAAGVLGLDPETIELFPDGSQVVGGNAERVVKLFPAFDAEHARTESRVLAFLAGRLPIATPALHAFETIEGWSAIAMDRLPGVPWRQRTDPARSASPDAAAARTLCREAGEWLAALHALDATPLADLEPSFTPWIAKQRAEAVARQRSLELDPVWLEQIEPFLAATDADRVAHEGTPVLLHTELMRDHILVEESAGDDWRVTGVIDFEPAMVGAAGYDLASVGLFVSEGDAVLLAAFLDGYGIPARARGARLARRTLAYALLHRYSHLPWYLTLPAAEGAKSLDELADRLFLAASA